MKYVYEILDNNPVEGTLQIHLTCIDVPHNGVRWIQYPSIRGVPSFAKTHILEEVIRNFRVDINTWEMWENNKYDVGEIRKEADAVVGNKETFEETLLDDDWLEDELDDL